MVHQNKGIWKKGGNRKKKGRNVQSEDLGEKEDKIKNDTSRTKTRLSQIA